MTDTGSSTFLTSVKLDLSVFFNSLFVLLANPSASKATDLPVFGLNNSGATNGLFFPASLSSSGGTNALLSSDFFYSASEVAF